MTTILPPSFTFDGDKKSAVTKKGAAINFSNFVIRQMEVGGINNIQKSTMFPDGSVIVVDALRNTIYNHIKPNIYIYHPILGEAIKPINDMYISIMSHQGDVNPISSTLPPYQHILNRDFYSGINKKSTINRSFHGGYLHTITSGTQYPGKFGGYWTNRKGLNLSWLNKTIYIDGKYCEISYPGMPSDYFIFNGVLFLSENTRELIAILFIGNINSGYPSSGYSSNITLRRFKITIVEGSDTFIASYSPEPSDSTLISPYPGSPPLTLKGVNENDNAIGVVLTSTFDTSGQKMLYVSRSLVLETHHYDKFYQTITLRVYSKNFLSYEDIIIEEGIGQHYSGQYNYTKNDGVILVSRIQPEEEESFGLLLLDLRSASGTISDSDPDGLPYGSRVTDITKEYRLASILKDNSYSLGAYTGLISSTVVNGVYSTEKEYYDDPPGMLWNTALTSTFSRETIYQKILCFSSTKSKVLSVNKAFTTNSSVTPYEWYDLTYLRHIVTSTTVSTETLKIYNGTSIVDIVLLNNHTDSIYSDTARYGADITAPGWNVPTNYQNDFTIGKTAITDNLMLFCTSDFLKSSGGFLSFSSFVDLNSGKYEYLNYDLSSDPISKKKGTVIATSTLK